MTSGQHRRQAARYIPGRPQVYGRSITGPRRCDPDAAARGAQQAARPDTAARARRRSQGRDRWRAGRLRDAVFEALEEICGSNRQDGDKVRPVPGLLLSPALSPRH